jgi:hypothetical protein
MTGDVCWGFARKRTFNGLFRIYQVMTTNIYCPRCSKPADLGTKYCRTCGLSLDGVSEIVSGETASSPEIKTRPNNTAIRIGIGLFLLGTALGLANVIVRELNLFPERYGKMIFVSFIIAGLVSMGVSFVFPQKRYVKKGRTGKEDIAETGRDLSTAELGRLPSAERNIDDFISADGRHEPDSVTEHTTHQLRR